MKAIDLFSGCGGFTTAAKAAGIEVVWAADHWPFAVEVHSLNHPDVEHVCQDLRQADWTALPAFYLLLASPACQGHSPASQPGRRPYHDAMRATAWAVIDCVEVTRPRAVVVENVPSFARWGLFDLWTEALRRLGYEVTIGVVRASHLGVPQRRDRLFVVGAQKAVRLDFPATAEPSFRACIEWEAPGWRSVGMATPTAQARIRAGAARHGLALVQHTSDHRGITVDGPIRTITTKDQWILVDGNRYRPLTVREYARGMGFSDDYALPNAARATVVKALGNAAPPPMARAVIERAAA